MALRTAPAPLLAALLLGAAALTGCSSDSDTTASSSAATSAAASPTASATATSALCTSADDARAALNDLKGLDVITQGTAAVKAQFATFQSAVDQLLAQARTDFAPEAAAVSTAVDGLRTAVNNLADSPSLADAKAVKDAVSSVGTSLDSLTTSVKGAC